MSTLLIRLNQLFINEVCWCETINMSMKHFLYMCVSTLLLMASVYDNHIYGASTDLLQLHDTVGAISDISLLHEDQ